MELVCLFKTYQNIQKKYKYKFLVISITGGELYEKFTKEGIETYVLKILKIL